MKPSIDRRLVERVGAAGESGPVEALIVVNGIATSCTEEKDEGPTRRAVDVAVKRPGELPSAVRYFPSADAVVTSASGRFIHEVLKDENLTVSSATNVGDIP